MWVPSRCRRSASPSGDVPWCWWARIPWWGRPLGVIWRPILTLRSKSYHFISYGRPILYTRPLYSNICVNILLEFVINMCKYFQTAAAHCQQRWICVHQRGSCGSAWQAVGQQEEGPCPSWSHCSLWSDHPFPEHWVGSWEDQFLPGSADSH